MANKKGKKTNNNNTIANTKIPEAVEVIEAPEVVEAPEAVEVIEASEAVEVIEASEAVEEDYVDNSYTAKELIEEAQKLIDSNHPFIGLITRLLEEVKTKLD